VCPHEAKRSQLSCMPWTGIASRTQARLTTLNLGQSLSLQKSGFCHSSPAARPTRASPNTTTAATLMLAKNCQGRETRKMRDKMRRKCKHPEKGREAVVGSERGKIFRVGARKVRAKVLCVGGALRE
jgi:hypothetical protein